LSEAIVTYRGYQGSVTYEDGALIIRVLHIRDFVSDECESATEVEKAFQELVEEYLADCAKLGKEPDRPFKGSFNVRVEPELHRQAAMKAAEGGCSLNDFVASAIREHVKRAEAVQKSHVAEFRERLYPAEAVRDLLSILDFEAQKLRETHGEWSTLVEAVGQESSGTRQEFFRAAEDFRIIRGTFTRKQRVLKGYRN